MKIYFDNCCFNRPFDDQLQLRIKLETEAKLKIQEEVRAGNLELAWSYMLDFENDKNPYLERKTRISDWRKYGKLDIQENNQILEYSRSLHVKGFRKIDALHISCAVFQASVHRNCLAQYEFPRFSEAAKIDLAQR